MAWLAGCVAGCVAGRMTWQAVCVVGHEQQQGRLHSRLHARVGKPLQQNGEHTDKGPCAPCSDEAHPVACAAAMPRRL